MSDVPLPDQDVNIDVCGDLPPDGTVCTGDTILYNKRQQSDVVQSLSMRKLDMEMTPDTLESVRVNELFVVVTVD